MVNLSNQEIQQQLNQLQKESLKWEGLISTNEDQLVTLESKMDQVIVNVNGIARFHEDLQKLNDRLGNLLSLTTNHLTLYPEVHQWFQMVNPRMKELFSPTTHVQTRMVPNLEKTSTHVVKENEGSEGFKTTDQAVDGAHQVIDEIPFQVAEVSKMDLLHEYTYQSLAKKLFTALELRRSLHFTS
ncbi:hypothetical protein O6P43_002747 [Quillaja saponaria]|uniref:Uncharacterized protein n=1 Tax=Quillaja saponaria TaxID=32244 RepID=A0AAD7QD52_QUISA|nr:hypothetical protein O6P43_002747 [Quillaja saponaria]